jgi:nucleoside-triphosphatase
MGICMFSAAIKTGKTTSLMNWCRQKHRVAGILMPDINGRRMFYDISSKNYFPAESVGLNNPSSELINVGKYCFYRSAFHRANQLLIDLVGVNTPLIIIDESGKLELKSEGLYPSIKLLIDHCRNNQDCNLLLVVREELVAETIRYFQLEGIAVVKSLNDIFF